MSKYNQKPYTAEEKRRALNTYAEKINYSTRYSNQEWEYRHVILPKPLVRFCPPGIVSEDVWRGLGIRQSPGWEMYMRHDPEPVGLHRRTLGSQPSGVDCLHVLLFRRPKNYDVVNPRLGASKLGNRMPVAHMAKVSQKAAK